MIPSEPTTTMLIVEDETLVRMLGVDMLEEAGFVVLEADGADEAIPILDANDDIDLPFSDVDMPGSMDGAELASLVRCHGCGRAPCAGVSRPHLLCGAARWSEPRLCRLSPSKVTAMRKLSGIVPRLAALGSATLGDAVTGGRLDSLRDFGSNPGALRAHVYIPPALRDGAALVVVLHGCTQTAAGYDIGAGWSEMADRHGFALLFPEQQRQNNPNLCFNWFSPEDSRRGSGEALSIRQMIAAIASAHPIDPSRIFVTGLSAGGAMVSVMLATYPEVFAGGAIIAGLPYGCASTIPQAFDRMRGQGGPSHADLSAVVSVASDHKGPWPTISVWHGSGDATVNPSNAKAIVAQWRDLHDVSPQPDRIDNVDGYPRRVWINAEGREVIEEYSITGMGHGTPLEPAGAEGCGAPMPFMLDARISSTRHIAAFWGLADQIHPRAAIDVPHAVEPYHAPSDRPHARILESEARIMPESHASGVGKVIEDALRAAGLMR